MRSLFGLQSEHVAALYPSQTDLAALGLSDPYATALVEDGETGGFFLRISKPDEGGTVWIYRDGTPLLYTARANDLPWLEAQVFDLMDKRAYVPARGDLYDITIDTPQKSWAFNIEHTGNGDEWRADLEGRYIDADIFEALYHTLISAELTEPAGASAPPPGEYPEFVLSITYRHLTQALHTVVFYEGPPRRCLIRVDGGMFYLTPSAYIERLTEALAGLDAEQARA